MADWASKFAKVTGQSSTQSTSDPNKGVFENAVWNSPGGKALGNIPLLGGLLQGITSPALNAAQMVAEGGGNVGAAITGQTTAPHFLSQNDVKSIYGPTGQGQANAPELLKRGGQDIAGVLSYLGPELAGKILPKTSATLGYLTKSGVGSKINQATEAATTAGKTDPWNDFATEVKQEVQRRLGKDPKYMDIVNSKLSAETPASLSKSPQLTPKQLIDFRRQASNRLPSGFLSKFQGKSATNQVDEVIRDVASKRAKDIIPGLAKLDKIYSGYSKIGSPAQIARNYAISQAIAQAPLPQGIKDTLSNPASSFLEELLVGGH